MEQRAEIDSLAARAGRMRMLLVLALATLALALVMRGLLISPSIGVPDVHLPSTAREYLAAQAIRIGADPPYLVGRNYGMIPVHLAYVMELLSLAALAGFIYGLVQKRAVIARAAAAYLIVTTLFGPLTVGPLPMISERMATAAISTSTAERLIGPANAASSSAQSWKRYIYAQIAYNRGDRATARRLSADLQERDLMQSEMRYRLQFLQGKPIAFTNVCFKIGCVAPEDLAPARTAAEVSAAIALILASFAGWFLATMRARLGRVDDLLVKAQAAGLHT